MGKRLQLFKVLFHARKNHSELSSRVYYQQLLKYLWCIFKYPEQKESWIHPEVFAGTNLKLQSDQIEIVGDTRDPILIVVVKDDYERMKLFFQHYRKIGIHQFIIIDNDSADGTREYCMEQKDARVYSVYEEYATERKEAWIERVICMTGLNRWYLIVDSDELLDYIGSERYKVQKMIQAAEKIGIRKIKGLLLDMYSKQPLFSEHADADTIEEAYPYFDKEGYRQYMVRKGIARVFFGGPRNRVYGTKDHMSKFPIVYYDHRTLLFTAHICLRIGEKSEERLWCVMRHYKFLNSDLERYIHRVEKRNFGNQSMYYFRILESYRKDTEKSFWYEKSVLYENSTSLYGLPLEEWESFRSEDPVV